MIVLGSSECAMATRASERLVDDCLDGENGLTASDRAAAEKLGRLGERSGLLVTGAELGPGQAEELLKQVVQAELAHWVPDSSQRLIGRAALVLGLDSPFSLFAEPDHGPRPQDHALIADWVCGIYVMRCSTCDHLFRV